MLFTVLHIGIEAVLTVGHDDGKTAILRISLYARLAAPAGVITVHAVKQVNGTNLLTRTVLRDNDVETGILIQRVGTKYAFKKCPIPYLVPLFHFDQRANREMVGNIHAVYALIGYDEGFVQVALTVGEDIVDLGEGLATAEIMEGTAQVRGSVHNAHAVLGEDLNLGCVGKRIEIACHDEFLGTVGNILDDLERAQQTCRLALMVKVSVIEPERLLAVVMLQKCRGAHTGTARLVTAVAGAGHVRLCGKPEGIQRDQLKGILFECNSGGFAVIVLISAASDNGIIGQMVAQESAHMGIALLETDQVGLIGIDALKNAVGAVIKHIDAVTLVIDTKIKGKNLDFGRHDKSPFPSTRCRGLFLVLILQDFVSHVKRFYLFSLIYLDFSSRGIYNEE